MENIKTELYKAIEESSVADWVDALDFAQLESASELVANSHNEAQFDFIKTLLAIDWDTLGPRMRMRWLRLFLHGLPRIHSDAETVIKLCHALEDLTDEAQRHTVISCFEAWLAANADLTHKAFDFLKTGTRDSDLMATCLQVWHDQDKDMALAAILATTNDPRRQIRAQCIRSLRFFNFVGMDRANEAQKLLASLAIAQDQEDAANAISTIFRVLEKNPHLTEELQGVIENACKEPSDLVRHELIYGWLYHQDTFSYPEKLAVFKLMTLTSKRHAETLNLVDMALGKLDPNKDKQVMIEVLTALLKHSTDAPELFELESANHKIQQSPDNVRGWYAIYFLLTGEHRLCQAASDLFPPLDQSTYKFTLDNWNLTEAEIFYLAKKVFGYLFHDHGPATSILAPCILALNGTARDDICALISDFWLRNYPADLELFEQLQTAHPAIKPSVNKIKSQQDAYLNPLQDCLDNPALKPSTMEKRIQAELDYQRRKAIHKQANEESILSSMFPKNMLLYGRSAVTYIYNKQSSEPIRQEIPLQSHSVSTPLPRMNTLHPTWLEFLLVQYRNETRPS